MQVHHDKLLGGYIEKLNLLLADNPGLQYLNLEELIAASYCLPPETGIPLSRSAGGVYNHFLYFDCMTPNHKICEDLEICQALIKKFGSLDNFRKKFNEAAMSVFGSGYAWLVQGRRGLSVITMPNQDNPLSVGLYPIFCLDVWEHAYFLMYFNKRNEYVGDWWNLMNWEYFNERYIGYMTDYNNKTLKRKKG